MSKRQQTQQDSSDHNVKADAVDRIKNEAPQPPISRLSVMMKRRRTRTGQSAGSQGERQMFSKIDKNEESKEKEVAGEPTKSESAESKGIEDHPIRSCSYLGPTLHVKGELTVDESLSIEGEVEGTIASKRGQLTVGKQGRLKAEIRANTVEVRGKVEGHIYGGEVVHLYPTAVADGTIHCGRIVMDDGAVLNGTLDMTKEEKPISKGKLTLASVSKDVSKIGG